MADAKELKIKFGVLKRVRKDLQYYEKELESQQAKIDTWRQTGTKDEYDIKKQQEVLEETKVMLPGCETRVRAAQSDLQKCLNSQSEEAQTSELYQQVETYLAEMKE